jgi:hypothetical protein
MMMVWTDRDSDGQGGIRMVTVVINDALSAVTATGKYGCFHDVRISRPVALREGVIHIATSDIESCLSCEPEYSGPVPAIIEIWHECCACVDPSGEQRHMSDWNHASKISELVFDERSRLLTLSGQDGWIARMKIGAVAGPTRFD